MHTIAFASLDQAIAVPFGSVKSKSFSQPSFSAANLPSAISTASWFAHFWARGYGFPRRPPIHFSAMEVSHTWCRLNSLPSHLT